MLGSCGICHMMYFHCTFYSCLLYSRLVARLVGCKKPQAALWYKKRVLNKSLWNNRIEIVCLIPVGHKLGSWWDQIKVNPGCNVVRHKINIMLWVEPILKTRHKTDKAKEKKKVSLKADEWFENGECHYFFSHKFFPEFHQKIANFPQISAEKMNKFFYKKKHALLFVKMACFSKRAWQLWDQLFSFFRLMLLNAIRTTLKSILV